MTYKQIEKEFDEWYPDWGTDMIAKAKTATEIMMGESEIRRRNSFKSFLKQSFIKYLQSEVERLEGEMFVEPSQAGQFAMHSGGYNQALEDQITNLQAQIKELESIKN